MRITDKEVKKLLKQANSSELSGNVASYPEDEIDGRTDMEIFTDELAYLVGLYEDEGTCSSEELEQARNFIRETKNGKVIPCWHTIPPTPKYTVTELKLKFDDARKIINEYNRLVKMMKRLGLR